MILNLDYENVITETPPKPLFSVFPNPAIYRGRKYFEFRTYGLISANVKDFWGITRRIRNPQFLNCRAASRRFTLQNCEKHAFLYRAPNEDFSFPEIKYFRKRTKCLRSTSISCSPNKDSFFLIFL